MPRRPVEQREAQLALQAAISWLTTGCATFDEARSAVRPAATAGFDTAWLGEVGGWDPLTVIAGLAAEAPGAGWGTSVVRTYPRHPLALAAQALTTQALTGGRLLLGVGPSHGVPSRAATGTRSTRHAQCPRVPGGAAPAPAREAVELRGGFWTVRGTVDVSGVAPPPILPAALGPAMLRIAGELAGGNIVAWAGPRTVGDVVLPCDGCGCGGGGAPGAAGRCGRVRALGAGRVRRWVDERYGAAWELPRYRRVFEAVGVVSVGGAIVAGDEAEVEKALRRYADAGTAEVQGPGRARRGEGAGFLAEQAGRGRA